jgi:hypothetical protein
MTTRVMSFEERYEGFCVDLIKVNIIYLSRVNRGNVFLGEIRGILRGSHQGKHNLPVP